jgi:hypothetical protein
VQTCAPKRHVASVLESGCWHEHRPDAGPLGHRPTVHDTLEVMAQVERSRED